MGGVSFFQKYMKKKQNVIDAREKYESNPSIPYSVILERGKGLLDASFYRPKKVGRYTYNTLQVYSCAGRS
jgi:hypothetical protein